jgi:hypothetical protein
MTMCVMWRREGGFNTTEYPRERGEAVPSANLNDSKALLLLRDIVLLIVTVGAIQTLDSRIAHWQHHADLHGHIVLEHRIPDLVRHRHQ